MTAEELCQKVAENETQSKLLEVFEWATYTDILMALYADIYRENQKAMKENPIRTFENGVSLTSLKDLEHCIAAALAISHHI